ncbi:Uncharacterised protein [uncultured Clostridium sp.]|nr:Uncharacterised protein [uncultured Clostridium sp.]
MSDAQVIEILKAFKEVLGVSSIWSSAFRTLMWYLNLGLSKVVDLLSNGLSEIYSVMNFFNSKYINDFIDKYIVVIFAFASIALAVLGWKIIIKKENDLNKIITNTLIAVTIFVVLPWGMQQGESLVRAGVSLLESDVSRSTKVFSSNITDLYVIDKNGWKSPNPKPKNYIKNDDSLSFLNITEQMDTGGIFSSTKLSDKGTKILKHKISDASGEFKLEELKSHLVYEDEGYYRYSWHPFFILIELGTIALVLFFTCFKTSQLILELGILKIIVQGTVLTDIETGQRNKKLIEKIKNTFIILYIVMLLLNIYLLFVDFIASSNISKPVQLIMILASGILVIDGPNFIEEIFGIDAGLKSIGRSVLAMAAGVKGAKMFASAIGKSASAIGKASIGASKAIGKTALHASAGFKGALDGFKENSNKDTDNNSMASPLSSMSNNKESQGETGSNTPLSGSSNNKEPQGETGSNTPLSGTFNNNEPQGETGSNTPLSGTFNNNEPQGETGSNTPLSGSSNNKEPQGETGSNTPLSGTFNNNEPQGETGSNTPLSGISNNNKPQGETGSNTPLSGISGTNKSKGNGGSNTPLSNKSGSGKSKGNGGSNTPLSNKSGSSKSKGNGGSNTPLSNKSGSSKSKGNGGSNTPLSNKSGSSKSKGNGGSNTPLTGSLGSSTSNGGGSNAPLTGSLGASTPNGGGSNAPLTGSLGIKKPKDIYKPNRISLPKDIDIKPIEKEPTTSHTIADLAVLKYADMAQQIYNSPTLKSARNTYNVSKNSVVALKKENNNEKRD